MRKHTRRPTRAAAPAPTPSPAKRKPQMLFKIDREGYLATALPSGPDGRLRDSDGRMFLSVAQAARLFRVRPVWLELIYSHTYGGLSGEPGDLYRHPPADPLDRPTNLWQASAKATPGRRAPRRRRVDLPLARQR